MSRPVIQPTTRQEAAAKALHDKGCGFNDWTFIHGGRFQDMDLAKWALTAADAWDADHGIQRTPTPALPAKSCPTRLMDGRNEIRCWLTAGHQGDCK